MHPRAVSATDTRVTLGPNNGGAVDRHVGWRLKTGDFLGAKKSREQLLRLRSTARRHYTSANSDGIVQFYERQNGLLETFEEADEADISGAGAATATLQRVEEPGAGMAMALSFGTNVALFCAKLTSAVLSGSLSIIASALDSFLDLLSGLLLFLTARAQRNVDPYAYPVGKTRLQPLGILMFASIMGTVSFQVLIESLRQMVGPDHTHHLEHLWVAVGTMVCVIVAKLLLWLRCRRFKSEEVRAYAQDHLNDVVTNSLGLASALLGDRVAWWVDPLGAMLLSLYIIRVWATTALENMRQLAGKSAPAGLLQKLTYVAWNHSPKIQQIDTVRAYTFGQHYFAEVDIVLPPDTSLPEAHDIGETLQNKLERMVEIERAFVHLDYEVHHTPEHPRPG
jgi:cation diffusion facilitator family transporter